MASAMPTDDTAAHAPWLLSDIQAQFRRVPTVEQVEEASSALRNAFQLGLLTPPVPAPGPRIVGVTEVEPWIEPPPREIATRAEARNRIMNRAIQLFCYSRPFTRMVTSVLLDANFHRVVSENEEVQAFFRNVSAPAIEDGDDGATGPRRNFNIFSLLYWKTRQAYASFMNFMALEGNVSFFTYYK